MPMWSTSTTTSVAAARLRLDAVLADDDT